MLTVCYSAKGGQGCSVVTALLALLHPPVTVIDVGGDIPAVLGFTELSSDLNALLASDAPITATALQRSTIDVVPGLDLMYRGTTPVSDVPAGRWEQLARTLTASRTTSWLVDAGTSHGPLVEHAGERLLVTRPCYLALRRAQTLTHHPTGIIIVREPGRALDRYDVEQVIGAPVVAELDVDPAIARGVDAGLLAGRVPRAAAQALKDMHATDRRDAGPPQASA